MTFSSVKKLEVWRTLGQGGEVPVGVLAQNQRGVFFQYEQSYLDAYANLSPFGLEPTAELQAAPSEPHRGLHGCFADSLPDAWGLLLQNRVFTRHRILPAQVTAMDRLALVGYGGTGALAYRPLSDYGNNITDEFSLHTLGLNAQVLFDERLKDANGKFCEMAQAPQDVEEHQTESLLTALAVAGNSGGARPKVSVFFNGDDFARCQLRAGGQGQAWLVKFTSQHLPLGHDEGICEAAYLTLAEKAGLAVPQWRLLPAPSQAGASHWLALKRFDRMQTDSGEHGRLHLLSACGLLDADFRSPSLDYEALIKASAMLCQSPLAGQIQFRRAIFNLFACNQDDHSKNWAFLQDDGGNWSLAPFYDVTFSLHPHDGHASSFAGFGKEPPIKAMQQLAQAADITWPQAQQVIEEVAGVIAGFAAVAKSLGANPDTISMIQQQLDATLQANRHLLAGN
ncbi:MAG: type II toxin-antitoxin system HipA family toxin [Pseudohongiellaceae bacterium]